MIAVDGERPPKRPRSMPGDSITPTTTTATTTTTPSDVDPFVVPIPEAVLSPFANSEHETRPSSPAILPLPTRLAYPFWYDPHPIAKWAADQLKQKLPPYNDDKKHPDTTETPEVTLAKMYGVLVVKLGDGNDGSKLGYLQSYSGTMPRPKYSGGNSGNNPALPTDIRFVPLAFDRFAKPATDDGWDFEAEEELLNEMTRDIEQLEACPERKMEEERWEETERKLQEELSEARKRQKMHRGERKARRDYLRKRLLADDNDSQLGGFESQKEAHICFLEFSEEYRALEDKLTQESAYHQREFKAIKFKIDKELETIQKLLEERRSEIIMIKQERKEASKTLQRKLFDQYKLLNIHGETKSPVELFKDTPLGIPPSGTGDCAAIKLFQHAFSKGYHPVALAEFWWGPSPPTSENDVARTHGNYYPCCRGKCEPLLTRHMLKGLDVESDPLTEGIFSLNHTISGKQRKRKLFIIYEDEWIVVVNKPHDVLSVPGRTLIDSIKTDLQKKYPDATGPILVHRLDFSTSGLLLAAKDSNTHKLLQAQFINRTVKKRYTALLEGILLEQTNQKSGTIDLPLAADFLHRPMQKVIRGPEGKRAVTHYEIVDDVPNPEEPKAKRTRVYFYPHTGRTHQLRVHACHPEGLGMAIVGDDIYGKRDKRLFLHAGLLEIDHPHTKERVTFKAPVPF